MVKNHLPPNLIKIEDILSIPYSLFESLATSESRSSSRIFEFSFFSSNLFEIHFTISSLLFYYQIPSQPIIIKSMFSFLIFLISGLAVIICSSGDKFLFYLYYKSPKALDKFKLPLTRPYWTSPPALLIRFVYC